MKPKLLFVHFRGRPPVGNQVEPSLEEVRHSWPRLQDGGIYEVQIYHDDGCEIFKLGGVCNCNPRVKLLEIENPARN
jgi:hypothetical protein